MTQTKAELLETKHQGALHLGDANSSNYVGLKAPATVSSNIVWTLPAADGSANQVLRTNGSGVLSWAADSTVTEGTAVLSTGESSTNKYLRTDGDGTCSWQTIDTSTYMPLTGGIFTGDVTFDGQTAGRDVVFDRSRDAFAFKDNAYAEFGDGQDLQIFHDGSHSRIKDIGTGYLILNTNSGVLIKNAADDEGIAYFTPDGAVELMYDASKKFETTNTGVTVTGTLVATTFSGSGASLTNLPAANITGTLPSISGANLTSVNATTLDSIDSGSFLRSDASDAITSGVLTLSSSSAYPLQITGSDDSKIILKGSSNPLIRFQEASTDKALVGWNSSGFLRLTNNEDSSELRIRDDLSFALDGSTFNSVIHAGNVGSGGALSSTNVYVNQIHGDGSNLTNLPAGGMPIHTSNGTSVGVREAFLITSTSSLPSQWSYSSGTFYIAGSTKWVGIFNARLHGSSFKGGFISHNASSSTESITRHFFNGSSLSSHANLDSYLPVLVIRLG